jgi:hypothetical protein
MDVRARMATAPCPDCGWIIGLEPRLREGQRFTCSNCGAFLEIINLEPPELDWAFSDFAPDREPEEELWGEEEWILLPPDDSPEEAAE